jgi:hypothetical protein
MRGYLILLSLLAENASAIETHCSRQEQVVFSCAIKSSKIISLCASKALAVGQGSLTYRFGHLGKVELEFPSTPINSVQKFRSAHYTRYQTDRTEISFAIKKYNYTIFDYYEGEQKLKNIRGVRVLSLNEASSETELLCKSQVKSELQKLSGIIPCDTENALASCN